MCYTVHTTVQFRLCSRFVSKHGCDASGRGRLQFDSVSAVRLGSNTSRARDLAELNHALHPRWGRTVWIFHESFWIRLITRARPRFYLCIPTHTNGRRRGRRSIFEHQRPNAPLQRIRITLGFSSSVKATRETKGKSRSQTHRRRLTPFLWCRTERFSDLSRRVTLFIYRDPKTGSNQERTYPPRNKERTQLSQVGKKKKQQYGSSYAHQFQPVQPRDDG